MLPDEFLYLILLIPVAWVSIEVACVRIRARLDRRGVERHTLPWASPGELPATSYDKISDELRGEIYQTMEWWDKEFAKLLGIQPTEEREKWELHTSPNGISSLRPKKALDPKPPTTAELQYDLTVDLAAMASAAQAGLVSMAEVKQIMERKRLEALECDECEYVDYRTYGDRLTHRRILEPCYAHMKKFNEFSLTA